MKITRFLLYITTSKKNIAFIIHININMQVIHHYSQSKSFKTIKIKSKNRHNTFYSKIQIKKYNNLTWTLATIQRSTFMRRCIDLGAGQFANLRWFIKSFLFYLQACMGYTDIFWLRMKQYWYDPSFAKKYHEKIWHLHILLWCAKPM